MNARLIAAGWRCTTTGRWIHPDAPPLAHGRRRLFTEAEALTLLAMDDHDEDTRPAEPVRLSPEGQREWDEWCELITKQEQHT